MNNFIGDNINALRIHKGLSQEDFAKIAGVSQTAVSAWECGTSTPRKSNVLRIVAGVPGIDYDDIMSEENGFAKRVLKDIHKKEDAFVEIPLFGSIAAGTPIEMELVEDHFIIPRQLFEKYPGAFLLKVEGESMNKKLPNGSYALIKPTSETTEPGAYAVCVNGYDATIKNVRRLENGFELAPDSTDPTFKPKVYDFGEEGTETITVIGKVVWFTIPFDFEI